MSGSIALIKKSFKIFLTKVNFVYFLKVYSVIFFISSISAIYSFIITNQGLVADINKLWISYLPGIILFPISIWAQASGYEAVKRVVGGESLEFKITYKTSWRYLWRFFLVSILVGLMVVLGLVLLIIPAVIFGVWFAFSNWGIVDKKQRVNEAISSSKSLVKGRFWKVLGRLFVFTLFTIIIQTGFAFIPAVGTLAATLFGGLFLLPGYLLFKELEAHRE